MSFARHYLASIYRRYVTAASTLPGSLSVSFSLASSVRFHIYRNVILFQRETKQVPKRTLGKTLLLGVLFSSPILSVEKQQRNTQHLTKKKTTTATTTAKTASLTSAYMSHHQQQQLFFLFVLSYLLKKTRQLENRLYRDSLNHTRLLSVCVCI